MSLEKTNSVYSNRLQKKEFQKITNRQDEKMERITEIR